jgi:L-alanine-DL-glutamate epimerase-like enolase superfamily enzyme
VRHDNYAGCARIAAEVKTPIQIGENLLNSFELQKAIDARAAEYYMPDVQRIGGVTGWLRAAAITHAHNLDMSSHLFPEFSVHLLAVTPTCHWLEYMDWANPICDSLSKSRMAICPSRIVRVPASSGTRMRSSVMQCNNASPMADKQASRLLNDQPVRNFSPAGHG